MFENFSFPAPADVPTRPRRSPSQAIVEPLTPPLSPLHSPGGPSPADAAAAGCYSYFSAPSSAPSPHSHHHSHHNDQLTATFVSLALSSRPPAADAHGCGDHPGSDVDSDPERERRRRLGTEDVRRKRQLMSRMQTSDDMLRQLGELVKRVAPGQGSRKSSAGCPAETSGVSKKPTKGHHHHHHHRRRHHHRTARTAKASQAPSSERSAVIA